MFEMRAQMPTILDSRILKESVTMLSKDKQQMQPAKHLGGILKEMLSIRLA
jgi:hypothetical protein